MELSHLGVASKEVLCQKVPVVTLDLIQQRLETEPGAQELSVGQDWSWEAGLPTNLRECHPSLHIIPSSREKNVYTQTEVKRVRVHVCVRAHTPTHVLQLTD